MSEPLKAVVKRDGKRWKATIDVAGDVTAPTLVELTYEAHVRAMEVTGKPQAIEFAYPNASRLAEITKARVDVVEAQTRLDRLLRLYATETTVDKPRDLSVLLGIPTADAADLLKPRE